jgi:hypothetical protein
MRNSYNNQVVHSSVMDMGTSLAKSGFNNYQNNYSPSNSVVCNDVVCCRVIQTSPNHYWVYCIRNADSILVVNKDI